MNYFTRRAFLVHSGAGLLLAPQLLAQAVSGRASESLVAFDKLMSTFLDENKVPGAALAISRGGKLVYSRGFGWADREAKVPVQPNDRFRIASISKPITAVAILKLADQRKLKLDDKVLDHVKLAAYLPSGSKADPRWKDITLRHCLHHTGGWDRDVSYDPITKTREISTALQCGYPVKPEHVCRYMMGQPLDFSPGERYAYSNLGFLLLGRVIESVTRRGYDEFVQKEILNPAGTKGMALGRALLEHRQENEVMYYDSRDRKGPALYGSSPGKLVPVTYGGSNLEAYEAHGGWIASAPDLLRFAEAVAPGQRSKILSPASLEIMCEKPSHPLKDASTWYGCGWNVRPGPGQTFSIWHSGKIGGTSTMLVRRADSVAWAILFNTDANPAGKVLSGFIEPKLHETVNAIRDWPVGTPLSS